ncbi:hypothetical protein DVS28_b0560 (plasmid) [Euzebya pacifica]|uniref:Uncharacterized protein n=1 Tax=Euzebya pacifica TaxID=1608957 RepID=A0A346Y753_9ACTN|nr:hypothetical protein [Euzebya pacifica]AXV10300.1 hypothetical protein DVS28_b0560 [Euzebya pacifica]
MTPDASPAGEEIEWVDGIPAIREYLADRLSPHNLSFGKHRVRELLDIVADPPTTLDTALANRHCTGRGGHAQTRSIDRALLDELLAGRQPTLASRLNFPAVPTSNVVPIRSDQDADVAAEDANAPADADLAAIVGERDALRERVAQLERRVVELRDVIREQATGHARVVEQLTKHL